MAGQELKQIDESRLQERKKLEETLEPQLRLFCYEYLIDYDHRRAAVAVKYSAEAGVRLLRRPEVARYIRLLTDELAAESLITRDMVQYELLHEFLPRAKGERDIAGVDRDGSPWNARVTNMAAYAKALELMSKHSGFTVEEKVKGDVIININHEAMGMGVTIEGEAKEVIKNGES